MIYAITGAIGSGKSVCMTILASLGYKTISVDAINAELLLDSEYLHKLHAMFSECFHGEELDKSSLRAIISADEQKRKALNSLAHREIIVKLSIILRPYCMSTNKIFVEVPLLVESKMENMFDEIWNIEAMPSLCIKRASKRDNLSESEIEQLFIKQATNEERQKISTLTINNDGDIENLKRQIIAALNHIQK